MRARTLLTSGLAAELAVAAAAGPSAADTGADTVAVDPAPIPGAALMAHIDELQKIADANGGNRAHGRPGYKASLDYVKGKLEAAGYTTAVQSFTYGGAASWNLVAEWPHGDADDVLMIGAHLDGVTAGPGINDNGSGTAAVLENALLVAKTDLRPEKRLRFAWWGTEEQGLIGSAEYLKGLSAAEKKKISLYLNFDMVGVKGLRKWRIYSESKDIADVFKEYFRGKNVPTEDYTAGSDQLSFKKAGVKVSGFGGKSDDGCYHKACDTKANVGEDTLATSTNAIASVSWKLAGARTER